MSGLRLARRLPGRIVQTLGHRIELRLDPLQALDGRFQQFAGLNLATPDPLSQRRGIFNVHQVVDVLHTHVSGSLCHDD
ncbi:hypothetical protein D3C80_1688440 [compost metagenome]